jgi:exodeoxyribonuclease VII large subunit
MEALSISQLSEHIQEVLEKELQPLMWVIGELADFRQAPQGHVYFELVEKQGNQIAAKIRANIWQYTFRTVAGKFEALTGTSLKNGMKVLAQVSVNFHPVFGLSLNVKDIDPSFSLGERARVRQETIDRLTSEGCFGKNASLPLPPVIQRFAIISSPSAAGYGDFVNQLENNPQRYRLYHKLFPSLMQGNEAVESLLSAFDQVEQAAQRLQLEGVVLIRGGGAQLDLDCFDDYRLGLRIANFPLPVFTGIGHERDETIADLLAHTRLKTPTAVAEFMLSSFREFEELVNTCSQRLDWITRGRFKEEEGKVQEYALQLKGFTKMWMSKEREVLMAYPSRLLQAGKNLLKVEKNIRAQIEVLLKKEVSQVLDAQHERILQLEYRCNQANPATVLRKGYTRSEIKGKPIQEHAIHVGESMTTYTYQQKISSTITSIEKK